VRLLNLLDEYNKLCLTIRVDRHCRVAEIINTIEDLLELYDRPVICKWTMAWGSSPRPYRSCVTNAVATRHTCLQVHPGRSHSSTDSTAGSEISF